MTRFTTISALLAIVCLTALSTADIASGDAPIAILASGDISDFGFNNAANQGRIYMERALNISGSIFAPNLKTEAEATAKIDELAALGYRLIISTTTAHVNAAANGAKKYPNISFVQSGGTSYPPNLSSLNFNGPDQYYILGVFCAANSKVGRIGFVHPGYPLASLGTVNAFYVGAKTANPNVEVFSVFTDSYLDPDRVTGAANLLLENGVDMLAGQQDDLTLQRIAMKQGFLAVGTTGFSLRDIFGESVGTSVVRGWGIPFTQYAAGVLSNLGGPFRKDISGTFATNTTYLDQPSHLVSAETWATVQVGVTALKGSKKPYFCNNPWVSELGYNLTTNCLFNNTVFTLQRLSGINYLGTYHVPLVEVKFPKSAKVAIIVLAGLLYMFTCGIAGALIYLRRDTVMLASSPTFLGLITIGCVMVYSAAIAWVEDPGTGVCGVRIWLPSIGFTLCMGCMIIKNVRLMIIFDAQLRKVRISDKKLLMWVSVLLAGDILLLGLWTGLGKPKSQSEQAVDNLTTYEFRNKCVTTQTGNHLLYAILAYHIAQLAVGCFVTFKIRTIDMEEFNESRPFGLSIYIVSLIFLIAGILIGTSAPTNVQFVIIVSLSLLIGSTAVLFFIFIPKFLTIFVKGSRPIEVPGARKIPPGRPATATTRGSDGSKGGSDKGSDKNNDSSSSLEMKDTTTSTVRSPTVDVVTV